MFRFSDEISPEEAREYGLSDHALTNSLDMRSPILQEEFMKESRTVDEKAGHVRKSMIRGY